MAEHPATLELHRRKVRELAARTPSVGLVDRVAPVIDQWPPSAKADFLASLTDAIAYLKPQTIESLQQIMAYCSANNLPLVPVGGASNVVGALLSSKPAVYVDLKRLNRIQSIDEVNCLVRCEAGIIGVDLEEALEKRGLTLGHYPQSLHLSTVGGWIATKAMGTFSGHYGGIEDSVLAVTAVLADGTVVETKAAPRIVGPMLAQLFVGAEGTLGVVAEVTLRVYRRPAASKVASWLMPNLPRGLMTSRDIVQRGLRPPLMRLYDHHDGNSLAANHESTDGAVPLLIALEGESEVVSAQFGAIESLIHEAGGIPADDLAASWFEERYRIPSFLARGNEAGFIGDAIDVVVWWSDVEAAYAAIRTAVLNAGASSCKAHFSHFYSQGVSIYFVIEATGGDDRAVLLQHKSIWKAAMGECQRGGFGIAHHHGIGLARADWYAATMGSGRILQDRLRGAMDPQRILNPERFGAV